MHAVFRRFTVETTNLHHTNKQQTTSGVNYKTIYINAPICEQQTMNKVN